MKKVQEVAAHLGVVPKLQLGRKLVGGGVESTGPHHVKFVEEPVVVMGKDEKGQPRKEFKFIVEEDGKKYRWHVPILSKEGQPSYMVERTMHIEVGDERIVELMKARGRNYIDVRMPDEESEAPDEEEATVPETKSSAPGAPGGPGNAPGGGAA